VKYNNKLTSIGWHFDQSHATSSADAAHEDIRRKMSVITTQIMTIK